MILWIQHEDNNAEDHEQSDDDNIQRNHDPKNGDTCYPGLGGWHSCFLASVFGSCSGVGEDEPCL